MMMMVMIVMSMMVVIVMHDDDGDGDDGGGASGIIHTAADADIYLIFHAQSTTKLVMVLVMRGDGDGDDCGLIACSFPCSQDGGSLQIKESVCFGVNLRADHHKCMV